MANMDSSQSGSDFSNKSKTLADDFAKWYEDGTFCDLVVKSGSRTFQTHRGVLSSKSKYFLKACTNGFQETESRIITLKEDRDEDVAEMIHFCYYGTYSSTPEPSLVHDVRMFAIAEKYLIPTLREYAVKHIRQALNEIVLRDNYTMSNWREVGNNQVDLVRAVQESYRICSDPEKTLRGAFIDYGVDHAHETFFDGIGSRFVRDVLKVVPEYGVDMFEALGKAGIFRKVTQRCQCTTEGCDAELAIRPSQLRGELQTVIKMTCSRCKQEQSASKEEWMARTREQFAREQVWVAMAKLKKAKEKRLKGDL